MRLLQLTTVVRDLRTATKTEHQYQRSPVTVGRGDDNGLRLDASIASRHHGAIFFDKGVLQYLDLHSANGTYVDGVQIAPGTLVDITDSSIITIGPFQIVVGVELVQIVQFPSDPEAPTAVELLPSEPARPSVSIWNESLARSEALQRILSRCGPVELLRRAADVIEVVAEAIIESWPERLTPRSPIAASTSPDEVVAYLIDREDGTKRLDELKELLMGMFNSGSEPARGWTS